MGISIARFAIVLRDSSGKRAGQATSSRDQGQHTERRVSTKIEIVRSRVENARGESEGRAGTRCGEFRHAENRDAYRRYRGNAEGTEDAKNGGDEMLCEERRGEEEGSVEAVRGRRIAGAESTERAERDHPQAKAETGRAGQDHRRTDVETGAGGDNESQ